MARQMKPTRSGLSRPETRKQNHWCHEMPGFMDSCVEVGGVALCKPWQFRCVLRGKDGDIQSWQRTEPDVVLR